MSRLAGAQHERTDNVLCLACGGRSCTCQRKYRLERMMQPGWVQPSTRLAWLVALIGLGLLWWCWHR